MITVKKSLPDLDRNHPFYSEEANKKWKKRIKIAEKEEEQLIKENRKRYKRRNDGNPETNGTVNQNESP